MPVGRPETHPALSKLIGRSAAMGELRARICMIARSPVPLLILGETGTGKEVCAEAIVGVGAWAPFIRVNCAALPESLVDAELFGYERGTFTGAVRSHTGLVAQAHRGVLFLDELGELPLSVQAKLLRTLESGEYRPLGSTRTLESTFRLVVATNGNLDELVSGNRMRADFVYRLGGLRIVLPPLRSRLEDIPVLAEHFLRCYRKRVPEAPSQLTVEAMQLLLGHSWRGNVRELRNVIEGAAALAAQDSRLGAPHILQILGPFTGAPEPTAAGFTLEEAIRAAEERAIHSALLHAGGNREKAAHRLGVSPATLYRKLARLTAGGEACRNLESLSTPSALITESPYTSAVHEGKRLTRIAGSD